MKIAFRIFTTLIFCLLLSACNGNKEDNNLREEFSVAEDLGIYKALGFNSGALRVSFAFRFLLVAIIGSILGCGLSIFITDPLAGKLFKFAGVGYFQSEVNGIMMLAEMTIVVGIFFVFSYFIAGKIKKTNPNILIQV